MLKNSPANAGDIPRSGMSPGKGNGTPLQYSCLGNPWTEEPGGLQSMGLQKVTTEQLNKNQQWRSPACACGRGKSSFPHLPLYWAQCWSRVVAQKKRKKKKSFIDLHELSLIYKCHEMHGRKKPRGRMGNWGGRGKSLSRKGRRLEWLQNFKDER